MPTPEEVIDAILGRPRDNPPSFVVNRPARRAALERGAAMSYRPFTSVRATPAPGPPQPISRVAACPRCALPFPCCCPR